MVPLVNMLLGEVVFGGLGTGLYSMVMAALIAVFLAGLMIGRTPEYLGKKIGPAENKMMVRLRGHGAAGDSAADGARTGHRLRAWRV